MATQKTEWGNLSEVQLKGALVRRGLDTSGTKTELIKRLQDHEEGKLGESADVEVKSDDDGSPILQRSKLNFGFYWSVCLKTVTITPLTTAMLSDPTLIAHLDEAMSYQLKKNKDGKSALQIKFATIVKGEAAYVEFKKMYADKEEVSVYHPWRENTTTTTDDSFEFMMKETTEGPLVDRAVILEKVPESLNTEEKLSELFPEVADVFSYEFDPASKGIAILEFCTNKEVEDFLKTSGEEVELEGEKISVAQYSKRQSFFTKLAVKRFPERTENSPLADQERINKTSEIKALSAELSAVRNSIEVVGMDKFNKYTAMEEKYREICRAYNYDTIRRIRAGNVDMPEGEENMLHNTRTSIYRTKGLGPDGKPFPSRRPRGPKPSELDDDDVTSPDASTSRSAARSAAYTERKRGSVTSRGSSRGSRSSTRPGLNGSSYSSRGSSTYRGRGRGSSLSRGLQKRSIGRPDSYGQPPSKRPYSSGRDESGSVRILEGLTSVLTDKMRTLEQLQHQTLKTQAQLINPVGSMGGGGGGGGMGDRGYSDGGNYGNTSRSSDYYGGGRSSYGSSGSYGSGNQGSSTSYYASPPSRKGSSGSRRGTGRWKNK